MRAKMGSACCVANRDRTIINGSSGDSMSRNIRYSPSWNVRWDNRWRVTGEVTSISWFSDDLGTNDRLDNKSQTTVGNAYASEEGSPLETFRNLTSQKSSTFEGYRVPHLDKSVSQTAPEVKGSSETHRASKPSPMMISSSTHSVSSASPLSSSQAHFLPTSSRCHYRSPGHHLQRQVSDSRIPSMKSPSLSTSEEGGSPFMLSGWSNESNCGSHVGSLDGWYVPTFNELMATSHSRRERWSCDSKSLNFKRDKISSRTSGRVSSSPSIDMRTCGICSMLLTERSSWETQKIIATDEIAVVAILICGHVYHSECLESMTSETNKYDPACPVCTFGEKKVIKLSEKALKADLELKARINKKSRHQVVDGDDNMFDHDKTSCKMSSSSSMKSSVAKHFLKRHFSFGSKGSRSLSDHNFPRKKGFFLDKIEQGMT